MEISLWFGRWDRCAGASVKVNLSSVLSNGESHASHDTCAHRIEKDGTKIIESSAQDVLKFVGG